jgi:hypothetical protein
VQDFTGIGEKLKRAEENILNLHAEMERFFQESDYPAFPEHDSQLFSEAIEYHTNLPIPIRFSVLSGEIVHQLRSCFDHIAWHFSVGPVDDSRRIEFPVFEQPLNHDRRKRFEGKIQGITDANVRDLIERLQPYNAADPLNDLLWIIHDLDIVDKHKELILCSNTMSIVFPRQMEGILAAYQQAHPELDPIQVAYHFKGDGTRQPCVSFRNFGRREIEPVIEGLMKLFNYTISAVEEFRAL